MDFSRYKKLKYLIMFMVLLSCFLTTSISFAYWMNLVIGNPSNATHNNISITSWNYLIDVAPSGIPEYDPNGTYANGDLVWYQGVIYRISHQGYGGKFPPGEPYGPFKDITMFYLSTNT